MRRQLILPARINLRFKQRDQYDRFRAWMWETYESEAARIESPVKDAARETNVEATVVCEKSYMQGIKRRATSKHFKAECVSQDVGGVVEVPTICDTIWHVKIRQRYVVMQAGATTWQAYCLVEGSSYGCRLWIEPLTEQQLEQKLVSGDVYICEKCTTKNMFSLDVEYDTTFDD